MHVNRYAMCQQEEEEKNEEQEYRALKWNPQI